MTELGNILLVDDSENDVDLTKRELAHFNLANEIVVVGDGVEALDYLGHIQNRLKKPRAMLRPVERDRDERG